MNKSDPLQYRTSSAHVPGFAFFRSVLGAANSVSQAIARRRLASEGLLELLRGRPTHAFGTEADDLWFLYSQVRRRRPKVILEFGSGLSTSVLAAAAKKNGVGRVISIDALPFWGDVTRKALADQGLSDIADVVDIPAVETVSHGRRAWKHESLPDVRPDFVYIDGPPLDDERPFSVDILELEDKLSPEGFIVIDGRKANFNFLRLHLRHDYEFTWRRIHYNGTIERRPSGQPAR